MNTKLVGILIGVVVVGAGAYYFLQGEENPGDTNGAETTEVQSGSFRSLAGASTPQKCTVENTAGGYTSSGVVYVTPGQMRADFTSSGTPSGTVESHMIVKDNVSYVWSSAAPQGIKMTITSGTTGTAADVPGGFSYDDQVNYRCEAWSPNQSVFELPSEITFMDMAAMMKSPGSAGAGAEMTGSAEQCKACDSLDGAQKAQCLVALSCK